MNKIEYIGDKNFVFDKRIHPVIRKAIKIVIPIWDLWWSLLLLIMRSRRKHRVPKYKFSICAIFKNETLGLKEWIEYHILIGVDHFYLYNNFSDDDYQSVLNPYIESGVVTLTEWPVPAPSQMAAYQDFYQKYRNETQWVAFIDLDEFICMREVDDIKEWIERFKKWPSVVAYWKQFGSNGLIEHDKSRLIIEQYTSCWDRYYDYGKTFFNLDYDVYEFSKNFLHEMGSCCVLFGRRFFVPPINEFKYFLHFRCNRIGLFRGMKDFSIQINHYGSKSYNEFFISKRKRGTAVSSGEMAKHIRSAYAYIHNQRHCITKDFTILRHVIELKLRMAPNITNYINE